MRLLYHDILTYQRTEVKENVNQKIGVNFDLKFEQAEDLNPSFAKAKVAIAYPGRNRNYSSISKETFEKALPSLLNIPLVGRYIPEDNDFGSHDIRVIRSDDGGYELVNATVPFGVVPSDAIMEWRVVAEPDGTEREYLFCDVLLWKRQYGYECLSAKDIWHQSMEIRVNSYVVDHDGYCVIEDMTFEALCILGDSVEPCFESASVQMGAAKAVSDYKAQFSQMLDELRQFGQIVQSKEENNKLSEDMKTSILAEYALTLEALPFEVTEDMTEESFRVKLDEMKAAAKPETAPDGAFEAASFAATYNQKREAIRNTLDSEIKRDGAGKVIQETYYWLSDFDDHYAFVERDVWTADNHESSVGRLAYSFDEGSMTASLTGEFEEMVVQWLTLDEYAKLQQSRNAFELLQQEYEQYKAEYCTKESDVEALRQFKNSRTEQDHKDAIDSVLSEFEELSNNEEFATLAAKDEDGNCKAYAYASADDLRKDCYAIVGKTAAAKFAKQPAKKSVKIPLHDIPEAKSPYGDLFEKFG